jgi:alkylresorcinol/alkylpyrone synthase
MLVGPVASLIHTPPVDGRRHRSGSLGGDAKKSIRRSSPGRATTGSANIVDVHLDGPGSGANRQRRSIDVQIGSTRGHGGSVLVRPVVGARSSARRAGPRIAALAVSDPETSLSQREVLERLGLAGDEFAEGIFERCGVRRRHLDLSPEFLAATLRARTPRIERQLLHHSIRAVDGLGLDPRDVGTVLSASLYSLGCPTLAHRLVDHYGMDPSTDKYHLTGVGCASAVPLVRLASQALREHPERKALIVAAESMSGIMTPGDAGDPRAKTVGAAIFGDGCAAALLSCDPRDDGPLVLASEVHQIPGTLGAVSMDLADEDIFLHLARDLPDLAGAGLPDLVERFLHRHHVAREDIDHWIVHPGGRRIIENVQSALELSDEDVATSWGVLADHGNLGTPSILYVLRDTIEHHEPGPGDRGLMVTIGPGVTVGMMLLGW